MTDFEPTHKITLTDGQVITVSLCADSGESAAHGGAAGPAYSEQEWHTSSCADFERRSDGTWTFQGAAFAGSVEQLP